MANPSLKHHSHADHYSKNSTSRFKEMSSKFDKRIQKAQLKGLTEPGLQAFCFTNDQNIGNLKKIESIEEIGGLNDEIRLEHTGLSEEQTLRWERGTQKTKLLKLCGVDDEETATKQDEIYYNILQQRLEYQIANQTTIKSVQKQS